MRESPNTQTSACTLQDCFLPPVAIATGQELSEQVSHERRLEFEDALSRNLPRFQRVAMHWLRNPEDAEDAVQDAMLSAFKHIASFEGRAQMSTWLMAILINAVRMQLRRRPRHKLLPLDQPTPDSRYTISDLVADQRPTPEQALEACELRRLVIELTGSLPPSQRMAMQLRQRDDGRSIKEAAAALRVPVGTLKAQLARGRVTLTKRLRKAARGSGSPEHGQRLTKNGKTVAPKFRTAAAAGGRSTTKPPDQRMRDHRDGDST
jgi:RNA polymerase sigma-70 factor (ECF subfamily)